MIAMPHNDRACLDAITEEVAAMVENGAPALLAVADEHGSTANLVAWIRALPQRDDNGQPFDGPKVVACRPAQRLRIPAEDPNCVERAALYLGAGELLDPNPVRRLATIMTPAGLHTFPTEDGEPVILDPDQSRNALRAGLFRDRHARNGAAKVAVTPAEAVEWAAELATEPASRLPAGAERVVNGRRAMRAVLIGLPLCLTDLRDVAFLLALADREAGLYGPAGRRVIRTMARAVDRLDQAAQREGLSADPSRNAGGVSVGGVRIQPSSAALSALGRVGGRLGYQVGLEALRYKLAAVGLPPPVLQAIDRELRQEGLTLGPLAAPSPMFGSLGALTPQALAGRWIAQKI